MITDEGYYPISLRQHAGNTSHFSSKLIAFPDHDIGIAILSSASSGDDTQTILKTLEALGVPLEKTAVNIPVNNPTLFEQYVGTYHVQSEFGEFTANILMGSERLNITIPEFEQAGVAHNQTLLSSYGVTFYFRNAKLHDDTNNLSKH